MVAKWITSGTKPHMPAINQVSASESTVHADTFVATVMEAIQVPGREGIYFLGPFSKRLSFTSQQNRALNLVSALLTRRKLRAGSNVAVVGGGVAGVMAAAALIHARCSVTIYERHRSVLARQRAAQHRFVHPTINQWPFVSLNPTTDFPFFDWYAGRCSDVVAAMETEWKARLEREVSRTHVGCEVTGLPNVGKRVRVECADPTCQGDYDAAIVATGFEDERGLDGSTAKSYWVPDGLDALRNVGGGAVWVSGLGDGGVIDALRLAHHDFASGRLVEETARALASTGLVDAARLVPWDSASVNSGQELADALEDLLRRLPRRVRERLDESLRQAGTIPGSPAPGLQVNLVGRGQHPYDAKASPIHLLLLAHAVGAGAVLYVQGVLGEKDDKLTLSRAGQPDQVLQGERTVVRHGPKAVVSSLLTEEELKKLELSQSKLSDFHVAANWRQLFPAIDGDTQLWKKVGEPSKRHMLHAKDFEADYPGLNLQFDLGGVSFTRTGTDRDQLETLPPDTFFGYTLRETAAERARLT